jgi:hypothetical protein
MHSRSSYRNLFSVYNKHSVFIATIVLVYLFYFFTFISFFSINFL